MGMTPFLIGDGIKIVLARLGCSPAAVASHDA